MAFRNQRGGYRRGRSNDPDSYTQPAYSTPTSAYNTRNQPPRYTPSAAQQSQPVPPKQEYPPNQEYTPQKQEQVKQECSPIKPSEPEPSKPQPQSVKEDPPVDKAPAEDESNENGTIDEDKPWKKKTLIKVPKKIRKKRLNAKLRNLLTPKNAMMVLHELHQDLGCVTSEEMTPTGQTAFTVTIQVEGKQYSGHGLSKANAKQMACENALKAALLEKMVQSKMEEEIATPGGEEAMDTDDKETVPGEKPARKIPEDDVPWGSLASYALYKLFSEWQAEGFTLPSSTNQAKPFCLSNPTPSLQPMKKIPADAHERHPVQLLNQLKPQCQYTETREGSVPKVTFTFTVSIDDQTFTGKGQNKKEAKKACAKAALMHLGIQYDQ